MSEPLKIFIGYDGSERIAYDVLKYSIEKNTRANIKIIPLYHKELRRQGFFQRPWRIGGFRTSSRDSFGGTEGDSEFAGTALRVLRTNWTCPNTVRHEIC